MSQKGKRDDVRPWLIVDDEIMTRYTSWEHFVQDFCRPTTYGTGEPSANGKLPIERLIALMYWGVRIEKLDPRERLERIMFYLHFADQYYKYSEHGEKLLNALGKSAYRGLVEHVLDEFFECAKTCWNCNDHQKNIPLVIEVAEAILNFFTSTAKHIPKEPHHKKTVDHVITMIRTLKTHPGIEAIMLKDHVKAMGLTPEFMEQLNKKAINALVCCQFYENMIKYELFSAMDALRRQVNNPLFDLIVGVLERKQQVESIDELSNWLKMTILIQDQEIGDTRTIGQAGITWLRLWALQLNPETDIKGWTDILFGLGLKNDQTVPLAEEPVPPFGRRRTNGGMVERDVL